MFISDVLNSGAIPSLEATLRFSGERHRLIAHNIANLDTPNFRPRNASPASFQRALAAALEERRERGGGMAGELRIDGGRQFALGPGGQMSASRNHGGGVLFHDRNNRDLERLMQDHAENAGVHRMASDLLRSRYHQLREAIAERV